MFPMASIFFDQAVLGGALIAAGGLFAAYYFRNTSKQAGLRASA